MGREVVFIADVDLGRQGEGSGGSALDLCCSFSSVLPEAIE